MAVAHQWLRRLWRATQRTHSPEQLLSDPTPANPIYLFLNTNQLEFAKKRTYKMLRNLRAGDQMYMPTSEKVVYPPSGLYNFLDYLNQWPAIKDTFEWEPSRAHHRADFVMREAPNLHAAAMVLKNHLGDAGWSE